VVGWGRGGVEVGVDGGWGGVRVGGGRTCAPTKLRGSWKAKAPTMVPIARVSSSWAVSTLGSRKIARMHRQQSSRTSTPNVEPARLGSDGNVRGGGTTDIRPNGYTTQRLYDPTGMQGQEAAQESARSCAERERESGPGPMPLTDAVGLSFREYLPLLHPKGFPPTTSARWRRRLLTVYCSAA
jgi:hypothetical protein